MIATMLCLLFYSFIILLLPLLHFCSLLSTLLFSFQKAVALAFALPEEYLFFHGVCQFTRYNPIVPFSEFKHVDKIRSPNLLVTSILWLSTVDIDFGGGRLEFLTGPGPEPYDPIFIEPKMGRFAAWTSSYENPHGVQEVYYGYRYAFIMAFTAFEELGHADMDSFQEWAVSSFKSGQ